MRTATRRCSRCWRTVRDAVPALQALLRREVSPAGAGGLARFLAACAHGEQAGRALEQFALELLERGADPFARIAGRRSAAGAGGAAGLDAHDRTPARRSASISMRATATA